MCKLITSLFICFFLFSGIVSAGSIDPTGPFGYSQKSIEKEAKRALVLESIIHGDGVHTVVINGQVMKPSDTIGEYKLIAVNDQSVVLRSKTQRLKLHIFNENAVNVSVVN
ncbi:MAG: hypothetical protein QF552_11595 [Litorilituus sp.]|nr:hypothetical protein [Litorilituus sp.]